MIRDIGTFVRAFGFSWASLMSGSLSVPFAIVAVFSEGWQQILVASLALLCILSSSFLVWRFEHQRANVAEARLAPKLEFVFFGGCKTCYSHLDQNDFTFAVRLGIRNIGGSTVEHVRVLLEHLEPVTTEVPLPAELRPMSQSRPYRNSAAATAVPLTLNPSGSSHEHINFLFLADRGDGLAIDFGGQPFFTEIEEREKYEGIIRAEGKDVPVIYAHFVYHRDREEFSITSR